MDPGAIILRALAVTDALELSIGLGPPHQGDDLNEGGQRHSAVRDLLGSAFPDAGWQGLASQAYCRQNADQQERAQTLADLDRQLAGLVKNQSDCVTHVRFGYGSLKSILIAAYMYVTMKKEILDQRIAFPIQVNAKASDVETTYNGPTSTTGQDFATDIPIDLWDYAVLYAFAMRVAALGVGIAVCMLAAVLAPSILNGQEVDKLTCQYQDLAASTSSGGTGLHAGASTVVGSVIPRLSATWGTQPRFSAMPPAVPASPAFRLPTVAQTSGRPRHAAPPELRPGATPFATKTPTQVSVPEPATTPRLTPVGAGPLLQAAIPVSRPDDWPGAAGPTARIPSTAGATRLENRRP